MKKIILIVGNLFFIVLLILAVYLFFLPIDPTNDAATLLRPIAGILMILALSLNCFWFNRLVKKESAKRKTHS